MASGWRTPVVAPCSVRAAISDVAFHANAPSADPARKSASAVMNVRRSPHVSIDQAVPSIVVAVAARNAVDTHCSVS